MKLLENLNLRVLVFVVVFLLGAGMGGMYTKIQYLEQGSGGLVPRPRAGTQPPVAPTEPPPPTKAEPKITDEDPVLGDSNAKLTIVEFGDFQCPFCGRFHKDTLSQIKKDYIETGKVKFVFKHLAFLGKESTDAANAAECAKEQGKFYEYHDELYNNQSGENQGAFAINNLKKFAINIGLNASQFNQCLDTQKYNAHVQADNAEANRLGFNSTPSTVIGDTPIIGAQPYNSFKTIIDQKLSEL